MFAEQTFKFMIEISKENNFRNLKLITPNQMKPNRLEPINPLKSRDGLPLKGEYFLSSFYKTIDRSTLLHPHHQNTSKNLSQKSLPSVKKQTIIDSFSKSNIRRGIIKSQTKEAMQFYSKNNKLTHIFNDPETQKSLMATIRGDRREKGGETERSYVYYYNKSNTKKPLVKTKPARLSLQIKTTQSENFQGLLNKFHTNLTSKTPEPNYLQQKIGSFLKKTRYSKQNQVHNNNQESLFKYKEFMQKFPNALEIMTESQKGVTLEQIQEIINSAKLDPKRVRFKLESFEDFKRLVNGQIIDKPIDVENLAQFEKKSEKKAIKEMLKSKKEEVQRLSRNPNLKIDMKQINVNNNNLNEVEEILSTSPLLGNQRKIVEQHRPSFKRSYAKTRKALKDGLIYLASLNLTIPDLMKNCVFSKKPYQKEGSYELIRAAKRGDLETMKKLLNFNRFLVFDFDDVLYLI